MEKDIYTAYAKTARAVEDITGTRLVTARGRKAEDVRARSVVVCILAEQGFSEPQIGAVLNRDHTTIHHHKTLAFFRKGNKAADPAFFELYTKTKQRLCLQ